MPEGYDMLAIPIRSGSGGEGWLVLSAAIGTRVKLDSDTCTATGAPLPSGWKGIPCDEQSPTPPIVLREHGGRTLVRLLETQTYEWNIEGNDLQDVSVESPLTDNRKQRWLVRDLKNSPPNGQFTVINHLGFSSLSIKTNADELLLDLPLEFVSKKLDFDTEYRRMTEDIADFCEQLLLTWEAPTSLRFSADSSERAKLLLERFLFLRNFLTPDRLGRLLEVIERNPHSSLIAEKEWKPAAMARSTDFLSNPGAMLRSWHRRGGRNIPTEVLDVRKEDTHDTAPNRFVKFALAQFRQICSEVMETMAGLDKNSTICAEAHELMQQLDAIMGKRFFRGISRLNRLPLDNQTLQKGEGYREILRAWLLTEAAASLNWSGQEESYQGSTRDVATLYEYWIFLKLHELLDGIDGMQRLTGPAPSSGEVDSFISESAGEITIHLQSGKQSKASFLLQQTDQEDLRIDLHYERTFNLNKSATSGGSYSRRFRPDYTLTIYPTKLETEEKAEAVGKVAHLHFDAKYRAVKLAQVFGEDDDAQQNDDSLIIDEKQESKTTSTYQRGDLLKMHTYNDALRQTIGSYVLYPGNNQDPTELRKFHEIAPGVGALVMKPGQKQCLETLSAFLKDVFAHQASQFTQYRYTSDINHKIIENEHGTLQEGASSYYVARKDAPCVMVWLKKSTANICRDNGFAYCHAVPLESKSLDLDLSIEVGSEFIPCGGAQGQPIHGLGWRAKITSARFMAKEKLLGYIEGKGLAKQLTPNSVDHYILFEFAEDANIAPLSLDPVHRKHRSGSKYMAVSCTWKEILTEQPTSG